LKYYIIAGEASGDLHASNLMKELKLADKASDFRFWGGDLMQQQGGQMVKHIKELAFMGFFEVIMNLRTILSNIKHCKQDIINYQPDAVIMVDYPGFNLRIAKFLKDHSVPVLYYISPQIWAWKASRIHQIKRDVTKMYTILPFEKAFYKKFNVDVDFVGHPLIDAIDQFKRNDAKTKESFKQINELDDRPIIAVLPGSRVQEINLKLPIMLKAVEELKDYQVIIAAAPSINKELYGKYIKGKQNIKIIYKDTYNILNQSCCAIVTSGTATLETALFKVPQVVCYKSSWISYQIAKKLIKVKYISLVNLILDKEAVKELIQNDLTPNKIKLELDLILNSPKRKSILDYYSNLEEKCGGTGASKITANEMFKTIQTSS
jgi:lipid-A-disaccharide synthase